MLALKLDKKNVLNLKEFESEDFREAVKESYSGRANTVKGGTPLSLWEECR